MDGLGTSEPSIKLVVKTPNQRVKDIEVSCLLNWTVEKLKSHLSTVYPTKPARSSQKIIYSGKLLPDHFVLKDVLQEGDGKHQTVHLVCTPSSDSPTSSMNSSTKVSSSSATSSPHVTWTTSSATTMQDTNQPDGLRQRHNAYAQHPFYNIPVEHRPHLPNNGQVNPNANFTAPLHPQFYMYPNAHYGYHNMHYAAQQMAHIHWVQHVAHLMQTNALPMQQNIPYPQQNIAQPESHLPQPNQPAAAGPQVAQAQERQENRNMVMNANAGGGMVQADDDEDNGQRDWLDYVYMAVRISMLMSIFWFYSSAERLIIMGLIVFVVWLIQSGVFNLNRAQRNRQQEPPVNIEDNNDGAREEPGEEQGIEEGIEGDTGSESESQEEDGSENNNQPHPGYFVVGYNFFVTFFTSLIPQAPGAIAQP